MQKGGGGNLVGVASGHLREMDSFCVASVQRLYPCAMWVAYFRAPVVVS